MKRVLVIQSPHLLATGILKVLGNDRDLQVFHATSSDDRSLRKEIKRVDPAVLVLVDCTKDTDRVSLFSLLANSYGLRVIVVEERKNCMSIYERKALEVKSALDLIAAIQKE